MGPPDCKKPRRRSIMVNGTGSDLQDVALDSNGDKIFDPCAEMMIHDFDDERTLDEEEALEGNEDPQAELSNLQKEGDMPLTELLAMYGYGDTGNSGSEDVDECGSAEQECKDPLQDDASEDTEEPSQLSQLYPELPSALSNAGGGTNRFLRSGSRPQSEEEEDDCDYSPDEEEWKKTIMVGSDYQAKIPVGFFKYGDARPYENADKMLWNPSLLSEIDTIRFLSTTQESVRSQTKDDEKALFLLLQCGYDVEEALRRRRMNCPPPDTMGIWSDEECRNFEIGMRLFGKDFHKIQKTKVRTRSVGELVQFYYLWKKTERHDVYAHKSRLEKKKYTLHPGITDYMDKFLEDQDVNTSSPSALQLTEAKKRLEVAGEDQKDPLDLHLPCAPPDQFTADSVVSENISL